MDVRYFIHNGGRYYSRIDFDEGMRDDDECLESIYIALVETSQDYDDNLAFVCPAPDDLDNGEEIDLESIPIEVRVAEFVYDYGVDWLNELSCKIGKSDLLTIEVAARLGEPLTSVEGKSHMSTEGENGNRTGDIVYIVNDEEEVTIRYVETTDCTPAMFGPIIKSLDGSIEENMEENDPDENFFDE